MNGHRERGRRRTAGVRTIWIAGLLMVAVTAASAQSPTTQPAAKDGATKPAKPSAPYTTKAWGAKIEPQPPGYVQTVDKFGLRGTENLDWLEFGLEHRTRFEYRDDDYRRPTLQRDQQFLMRTRGYVGVRKILDPFRFGIEFQDARQFNSDFPEANRDVDEADFLQAFGELYFKDALGPGEPFRFQAGRMTLEYIDRRLIGRNRFRNTVNAFDGFRIQMGESTSDWEVDVFAAQPVERRLTRPDVPDEERWVYGIVGMWRKWSKYVTIEPYYYILDEDRTDPTAADREIHMLGLHTFGPIAGTGFDYDTDVVFQFGDDGPRDMCAFGFYSELGYTFTHPWTPRLSFSTLYGSGDRDPSDARTERFDRLYAPNHPWSMSDFFSWTNTISPKLRLEFKPHKTLRADMAYGTYWLASDSDAWNIPGRRDRTGTSGDFVGQDLEVRLRYQPDPRVEIELGYSHFIQGDFVDHTGPADDSDFFYVQTTFRL